MAETMNGATLTDILTAEELAFIFAEEVEIIPECAKYIGSDLWKGISGKTYILTV